MRNPTNPEVERTAPSAATSASDPRAGGQPSSPARRSGEEGTRTRAALAVGAPASGPDALGEEGPGPLVITVIGRPAPQGSKRHVGGGRMVESSKRLKPWREAVKQAALDTLALRASQEYGDPAAAALLRLDGPVRVEIAACFDPPKSAPKKRRIWPTTRSSGDADKIARSCLDALTDAGAFRDDSQVIDLIVHKHHTTDPDAPLAIPGAVIAISEVSD